MPKIYRNIFMLFLSVALSESCSPCNCGDRTLTCDEIYPPIEHIPVIPFSQPVEELKFIDQILTELSKDVFQNAGLSNLMYIVINRCKLATIHEEAFNNVTNLLHLDLSYNDLSTLSDNMFKSSKYIQYLYLQHNKLKTINEKIFSNLEQLQNLDLCNNLLTSFSANALLNNKRLKQLHLNNNQLNTLNIEAIENIQDFKQLKIGDNPWTCDCLIRDLFRFMKNKYEKDSSNFKQDLSNVYCNAPTNLQGNIFWSITQGKLNCEVQAKAQDPIVWARIGQNPTLHCIVNTTIYPTGRWTLNGMDINATLPKYVLKISKSNQVSYSVILEIIKVKSEDEGTYKCIVTNNITVQTSDAKIDLKVDGDPITAISIIIIVVIIFCALCLAVIVMKCAIKCSIISKTNENPPDFQESIKLDDEVSLKIEKA